MTTASVGLDPVARTTLDQARAIAERLQHDAVTPLHLLAGLLTVSSGVAPFVRLGVDFDGLKERIRRALSRLEAFVRPLALNSAAVAVVLQASEDARRARRSSVGVLDLLVALSASGGAVRDLLDGLGVLHAHVVNVAVWLRAPDARRTRGAPRPIVGRDREISEVLRIFTSGQHGVVLVGEPGVGKDAVCTGVAERLAADDAPAVLRGRKLVWLPVERLADEASPEGLAADRARGALLIATATPEAYRQHVERTSLDALFERVPIAEPTGDDAVQIVAVSALLVEERHGVSFSYGAVAATVEGSHRYLRNRNLPEKAVALLDAAAAAVADARGERAAVTRADIEAFDVSRITVAEAVTP